MDRVNINFNKGAEMHGTLTSSMDIQDDQSIRTENQERLAVRNVAVALKEITAVENRIPDNVNCISEIDEIADIVDGKPGVVHNIPAHAQEAPDFLEEARADTQPDDKALLDLIGRASPHPAIDFLKEARSLSQAALDTALIQASQFGFKYLAQKLVQLGADIECQDASGKTPLLICVKNRYLDLVRFLVAKNADVQADDYAGNNALILSINYSGMTEMTQFFLKQESIKINHQNKNGYTAVMQALEFMDMGALKLLLKYYRHQHVDCWMLLLDETVNYKGETAQQIAEKYGVGNMFTLLKDSLYKHKSPLLAAVELCDLEIVSFFLKYGITTKGDITQSLSHIFIKRKEKVNRFSKEEVEIIKRLLKCGADGNMSVDSYLKLKAVSLAVEMGDYNLVELLCQHGTQLNQPMNKIEKTPLSVAAKYGRIDFMELLLNYNADIDTPLFINSPLDCALIYGHVDCARFLLNHGAMLEIDLAITSAVDNQTPEYLQFLFQNYEQECIEYLLAESKNENCLLVNAVQRGNEEIIEQILRAGVDINEPQRSGATPIVESKNGAIARFLIQRGADVNVSNAAHETPLIHLLKKLSMGVDVFCIEEVVQVLLENGACVNAKTSYGQTPLMKAATAEGHEAILQMLLDYGADYAEIDTDGNTSLMQAIKAGCLKNASLLIGIMKNKPDLLNLQNFNEYTALMHCMPHGNYKVVSELIDNGGDINIIDCKVMSELIDNGADVNITDFKGNTALHFAVESMSNNTLEVLINAGCDINQQNYDGLSPLMSAVSKGIYNAIPTLVDFGADVNAVNHRDNSKTAISYFSIDFNLTDGIPYLKALLDKGASASYLSPRFLFTIIMEYSHELIPTLVSRGLAPTEVTTDEISLPYGFRAELPLVSPLCLSLLMGNVALARYFWENLYLTHFDVSSLPSNKFVESSLQRLECIECLRFHAEIFSQPMSLFKKCFVAVTSAVGASPGREERVNKLPLPQVMKDRFLFKSEVVSLNIPDLSWNTSEDVY